MSDPIIVFDKVTKSYDGATQVVKSLDFAVERGEFVTLLGPSGSGKTTTLMMLAGFEDPSGGTITFDGRPLNNVPAHRRGIGVVFQNYALFPHMSVAANLSFPMEMQSVGRAEREERVRGALDMVNFFAPETVPERYRGRLLYPHNPQITLMRTTAEENARMGRWIGERLNQMDGPVRFLLPEGGVSALDAPGQPFWDPEADAALFRALERTVRATGNRELIRVKHNINDPEFASTIVSAFRTLFGRAGARRRAARATRPPWHRCW